MPALSAAQTALAEVLRQRLAAAGCQRGRFDVSEPGPYLSLSGEKADGKALFFWEFGHAFHELVAAFLMEQYDEHTARLTIQIEVASAQVQCVRTPRLAPAPAAEALALPATPTPSSPDRTPYGLTLAAQVAARLDQGATLAQPPDYCGRSLGRGAQGGYQYGEFWHGAFTPAQTFGTWAAFVAWLAAQSDYSLAEVATTDSASWDIPRITRQRLEDFVGPT